jgi:ubiquinone/menaquinone biosynthesis C-methylase UbiE
MRPSTDTQQQVTGYFESAAAYWRSVYADDSLLPTIYQDRHATVLGWIHDLNLRPDARILEVGCGAGLVTVALAGSGYTVHAVDPTPAMLRMTRDAAAHHRVQERIRLHAADVHALPFHARAFDLVVAVGVIPWLHSEGLALQEMQRVLKPGGFLLVTADNNARLNRLLDPRSSPLLAPLRMAAKQTLRLIGSWVPSARFQPKRHYPYEVTRAMSACGFATVKSCTVGFGPFTFLGKTLLPDAIGVSVHRRLQTLASRRGVSPLRWTGSHYLVLATRP